jgi:hypothetical protein
MDTHQRAYAKKIAEGTAASAPEHCCERPEGTQVILPLHTRPHAPTVAGSV